MPENRPLRVVIVADTHSRPHPDSAQRIQHEQPDAILHAGDVGNLDVLEALGAIAPVTAVRGNIDERAELPDSVDLSVVASGQLRLKLLLTHIAVQGPKLRADAARLARLHDAAMVVCGHSHVPFIGMDRGLTVFNPGSIGPRRFHLPIVFGLMTVGASTIDLEHIDCESGERWTRR